MRLTLRTMLAYLDGILEADDAQDIGKKIEDSQYATGLLHRIRDVMRRLRLAAPSISERAPGLDANTVAEYLDNTLPADGVPVFEKVCLESDIHLAEVASCHQVLAAVLGEPVEIDPESRQRMYQLPQVAAQAAAASRDESAAAPSGDGAAGGDAASHQARPRAMVPEYLREPPRKRSLLRTAAVLVLAGCVLGVLLWASGLLKPLENWVRGGHGAAEVAGGPKSPKAASGADKSAASEKSNQPSDTATSAQAKGQSKTPSPATTAAGQTPPVSPTAKAGTSSTAGAKAGPGLPPEPANNANKTPAPAGNAAAPPPNAIAKNEPPLPPGPVPAAPVGNGSPAAVPPALPPEKTPPEKKSPAAPLAERMGHFISEDQVLLQSDAKTHDWMRVVAGEPLLSGRRLLAMPNFRDDIALDAGVTLQMVGGAEVQLLPAAADAPAGLEVVFGRVLLQPVAQGGRHLRLRLGGRNGLLTLVDSGSIVAVEVVFHHPPGTNPETEPPQVEADLYAVHGAVRWQEPNQPEPLHIMAPARLTLGGPTPPEAQPLANKDLPKWIEGEPLETLNQQGRSFLAQSLQAGRSAERGLKELADHRRSEVARLARRCLAYLDDLDPAVAALNDPDQRQYWYEASSGYVEQLREAVARGPETAAAVHEVMERRFGHDEGDDLYRMLWGYTNKDLQNGADVKLVQLLEHEKLAFRVLSFWNLKDITGMKLYYQPEQTAAKRRRWVTEWKKYQQAGKIRIRGAEETTRPAGENTRPAGENTRPAGENPPPSPPAISPVPPPPPPEPQGP